MSAAASAIPAIGPLANGSGSMGVSLGSLGFGGVLCLLRKAETIAMMVEVLPVPGGPCTWHPH